MSTAISGAAVGRRYSDEEDWVFVSFSLGPVQTFIEAARSVRDLWSGSYLLSYLTFRAMTPILDRRDAAGDWEIISPAVEELPLWYREYGSEHARRPTPSADALLMPCIPNRFTAIGPPDDAERVAEDCSAACRRAWLEITAEVRRSLDGPIHRLPLFRDDDWSRWDSQVSDFFEIRTMVLRWQDAGRETLRDWVDTGSTDRSLWTPRLEMLARLLEAKRSVRHVPAYFPEGDVPQKCTLLGSYEQMGPARLSESREFWPAFSREVRLGGTGIDRGERLCAVSLVKRFAWAAYFSKRLNLGTAERRYPDTATIAAAEWLAHPPAIDPDWSWERCGRWSGQWLHWKKRDDGKEAGEGEVPGSIWEEIKAKRKSPGHPATPTYYAVLMLDGDRMGRWLRGDYQVQPGRPHPPGEAIQAEISRALGRFAMGRARGIVEGPGLGHQGTLVYSGGDDVLAMLPTGTALACARRLQDDYRANWPKEALAAAEDATVSAGIAVAHHKEDLRFVLDAARRAEKGAKAAGRDILALTVCRRSGEHATSLVPWGLVEELQELVEVFRRGASDRWTYILRSELPSLETLRSEAFEAEVRRLIARSEDADNWGRPEPMPVLFLRSYLDAMRPGEPDEAAIRRGFVTLLQSASFLARGREDR